MGARPAARRLVTAYALWLFVPFYPLYAMYLGRDLHCWLYTVTFGGFGIGWVLDSLAIPLYVADHNEPSGYAERAQTRHNAWFAWSTIFAPGRWLVLSLVAAASGIVAANLLPPNSMLLPVLGPLYVRAFGAPWPGPQLVVALRLLVAVVGASLGLQLATPCVLTVRRSCRWRHMLGWGVAMSALQMGSAEELEVEGHAPRIIVVALAATVGALRGRTFAPYVAPKDTTRHAFTLRLVRQAVGVGIAALACGGAFYLNGSYTVTDRETGATTTYTGGETFHMAYTHLRDFGGDAGHAIEGIRRQYRNHTWAEIFSELRAAFADPAVEAAEVLEIQTSASASEIRKAHRDLARLHHPDKVGDSAEAQQRMSKLNWAKEVLLERSSGAAIQGQ